jgi:ArsR family transcriptional regulator, arsenate/arsenite/antimonite-responsive transcriptional repressor
MDIDIVRDEMRSANPDVMLLAALADPVRLSIVRQLAESDGICACDFTECCDVSQPTISHHLKVLREAGVLTSERQGTNIVYSLSPDLPRRFGGIGASLAGLVQVTPAPARGAAQ